MWIEKSSPLLFDLIQNPGTYCHKRILGITGPTIIHPVVFLSVLHAYHYPISAIGTSISSGRLCENISAYTGTKRVNTSEEQGCRWTDGSAAQGCRHDVTKDAE